MDYLESQDWDARYRTPPRGLRGRLIEGTYRHLPNRCPICRTQNKLIKFGSKTTDYRDAPHDGNPLTIRIRRQRFKCRHCGNTFLQSIPDMDEHRRMTSECVAYICTQALREPLMKVADQVGVDEKTVRILVEERLPEINAQTRIFAPHFLGIGEVEIAGKVRTVYIDLAKPQVLDIGTDRRKSSVVRWLSRLSDQERVMFALIDMRDGHYEALRKTFGRTVRIAVDPASAVALAEKCVGAVERRVSRRRRGQPKPDPNQLPDGQAARDRFLTLYKSTNLRAARKALREWRASLTKRLKADFHDLLVAINEWGDEMSAIFEFRFGGPYSRRMAGLLLEVEKQGRESSFEIVRARALTGAILRPPDGARRCIRCDQIIRQAKGRRMYPHSVDLLPPALGADLMEMCSDCHKPYIAEFFATPLSEDEFLGIIRRTPTKVGKPVA